MVHVQHAGTGAKVLDYLARYVFRIAIVNSRLEHFAEDQVTFRYRDGRTGTIKRCTLDAVAFLGRFLQHVLPQGFSKVRHDGLFSPARHDLLAQARAQLMAASSSPVPVEAAIAPAPSPVPAIGPRSRCPACGIGVLHIIEVLHPGGRSP